MFKYTQKDAYDTAAYQLLANPSGVHQFVATNLENENFNMLDALCQVGGNKYMLPYLYNHKVFAIFIKNIFLSRSKSYARSFPWDKINANHLKEELFKERHGLIFYLNKTHVDTERIKMWGLLDKVSKRIICKSTFHFNNPVDHLIALIALHSRTVLINLVPSINRQNKLLDEVLERLELMPLTSPDSFSPWQGIIAIDRDTSVRDKITLLFSASLRHPSLVLSAFLLMQGINPIVIRVLENHLGLVKAAPLIPLILKSTQYEPLEQLTDNSHPHYMLENLREIQSRILIASRKLRAQDGTTTREKRIAREISVSGECFITKTFLHIFTEASGQCWDLFAAFFYIIRSTTNTEKCLQICINSVKLLDKGDKSSMSSKIARYQSDNEEIGVNLGALNDLFTSTIKLCRQI